MRAAALVGLIFVAGCNSLPTNDANEQLAGKSGVGDEGKSWVTSQYLDRYTCPSKTCGVVGRLFLREAVTVLERKADWARITKTYDANCANGLSGYVDKGKAVCSPENGIMNGQFAEWVLAKHLSSTRPADPAETAAGDEAIVAGSDDFRQHRKAFAKAAHKLISDGRCTAEEFKEMGGWVKSSNDRDRPVYFMYCGGMTLANRLYLNAVTGEIYI
jgi:hypothetical protein